MAEEEDVHTCHHLKTTHLYLKENREESGVYYLEAIHEMSVYSVDIHDVLGEAMEAYLCLYRKAIHETVLVEWSHDGVLVEVLVDRFHDV